MILNPKDDGITHINVYSKGQTDVGRLLSNFAFTPFEVPDHGPFASVEGYWYWLPCKDERLRHLSGFPAKKLGRSLRPTDWRRNVPDFNHRIIIALHAKLDAHPRIVQLMHTTAQLPFVHYYITSGRVQDHTMESWWMLNVFNDRRKRNAST